MPDILEKESLIKSSEESSPIINDYFEEQELRENSILQKAVEFFDKVGLTPEKIRELDVGELFEEVDKIPGYKEAFYAENLREKIINPLGEEILKSLEGKGYETVDKYISEATKEQIDALRETVKEKLGEEWAVSKDMWLHFKKSPETMLELEEFRDGFTDVIKSLDDDSVTIDLLKDAFTKAGNKKIGKALQNRDWESFDELFYDFYDIEDALGSKKAANEFFSEKLLPALKQNEAELEKICKCFSEWFFEDGTVPEFLSFDLETVYDLCDAYKKKFGETIRPNLPGGWWR